VSSPVSCDDWQLWGGGVSSRPDCLRIGVPVLSYTLAASSALAESRSPRSLSTRSLNVSSQCAGVEMGHRVAPCLEAEAEAVVLGVGHERRSVVVIPRVVPRDVLGQARHLHGHFGGGVFCILEAVRPLRGVLTQGRRARFSGSGTFGGGVAAAAAAAEGRRGRARKYGVALAVFVALGRRQSEGHRVPTREMTSRRVYAYRGRAPGQTPAACGCSAATILSSSRQARAVSRMPLAAPSMGSEKNSDSETGQRQRTATGTLNAKKT